MNRWRSLGALAVVTTAAGVVLMAASGGTIVGRDQGAARAKGLSQKERNALDLVSVKATGVEPLGVIVTATFKGSIEQALGRGHLKDGIVALILRPKGQEAAFAGVATFGAGAIGLTARKSRSTDVGVVRKGRAITFFVGGPGFENVGKVEVKAFARRPASRAARLVQGRTAGISSEEWEKIGEEIASDEAALPAPRRDTSCNELESMKQTLDQLDGTARSREKWLNDVKRDTGKAIAQLEQDLADRKWERAGLAAVAVGNTLATSVALLLPPLGLATAIASIFTATHAGRTGELIEEIRGFIRSLKFDLRLIDAYLDKVRTLRRDIRELAGKVDAYFELNCERPVLKAITASFDPNSFTTTYTEDATGAALTYTWGVSIPDDPDCAAGFKGNTPKVNQATWFHKDKSQGGQCNHDGQQVGPRGHIGEAFVDVSNLGWTCRAIYFGTQGDDGSLTGQGDSPHPCSAK